MYVYKEKSKAVVFNYLVNNRFMITATPLHVVLKGLEKNKKYAVKELNVYPGARSTMPAENIYSGDFLMKVGVNPNVNLLRTSVVLEITEVK